MLNGDWFMFKYIEKSDFYRFILFEKKLDQNLF